MKEDQLQHFNNEVFMAETLSGLDCFLNTEPIKAYNLQNKPPRGKIEATSMRGDGKIASTRGDWSSLHEGRWKAPWKEIDFIDLDKIRELIFEN